MAVDTVFILKDAHQLDKCSAFRGGLFQNRGMVGATPITEPDLSLQIVNIALIYIDCCILFTQSLNYVFNLFIKVVTQYKERD
jgi:hypothetical protein